MPPAGPLITLLTDFGDRDYFVASMKGVILSINPDVRIVDLSHQIVPHQIEEAGYVLQACYRYFPKGSIHVAVVDPGVGSDRRALLVSTPDYSFLAPDNGLLTRVLKETPGAEVRKIQNRDYRLPAEGSTFDGRDLFAPAAARLTMGTTPSSFGPVIHDPVRLSITEPKRQGDCLVGRIEYIDRFGNLISNLTAQHIREVRSWTGRASVDVSLAGRALGGVVSSYSDGTMGEPAALVNSNGRVEVFVNGRSAAQELGLDIGAELVLC